MTAPASNSIRSPSYPSMSLNDAVGAVRKIESLYRLSQVDRVSAAKLIGYSSLSGPANKALAALAHFGLVERAGKGEMRVTARAQAILHPNNEQEKRQALRTAAFEPDLFRELNERWPDMIPPEEGVATYLNRQGFNQTAVRPAVKAYLQTLHFLEEAGANKVHGAEESAEPAPNLLDDGAQTETVFGGARVGDLIQWESGGTLQLEKPMRVRVVSEDGQYVAVEGSETGIPMSEAIVQERGMPTPAPPAPRHFRLAVDPAHIQVAAFANTGVPGSDAPELEWMRNRLSSKTNVRLLVAGEMGPREIGKLIKLLEAQKAVLEDDDDE